jgi:Ca2+/H+ antiporter, TMEM165/GDT1 family
LRNVLTAFTMVFPAELPDKSMFATLVLTSRFRRPAVVWCGVAAAFAMHVVVAVSAGSVIHRFPARLVGGVTAALFAVGAVMLWRESNEQREQGGATDFGKPSRSATSAALPVAGGIQSSSVEKPGGATVRLRAVLVTSFVTVGLAEWGDLTQLATASLAADRGDPLGVGLGAYLALVSVAGLAAFTGRWIVRFVPLQTVRRIAAVLFAALALWTLIEL